MAQAGVKEARAVMLASRHAMFVMVAAVGEIAMGGEVNQVLRRIEGARNKQVHQSNCDVFARTTHAVLLLVVCGASVKMRVV